MKSLARAAALLIAALAVPCSAADAGAKTLKFRGYAYDLASNRFLYTEVHEQHIVDQRWLGGSIAYFAPDGSELGRKSMDFRHDPFVPLYQLDLKTRGGYMESIVALTSDRIEMAKQAYGARSIERASIRRPAAVAADSGFHAYVREHFAELLAGGAVPFTFAVAGNLDAYKFRARRIADTTFEGRPAVRFRVEPDSLLRWLVDPLELTYEVEQRKLLEYRGISNIHDPATGKAYNARIIYPSTPPADAPALPASL
jgi:hypothetical protein